MSLHSFGLAPDHELTCVCGCVWCVPGVCPLSARVCWCAAAPTPPQLNLCLSLTSYSSCVMGHGAPFDMGSVATSTSIQIFVTANVTGGQDAVRACLPACLRARARGVRGMRVDGVGLCCLSWHRLTFPLRRVLCFVAHSDPEHLSGDLSVGRLFIHGGPFHELQM